MKTKKSNVILQVTTVTKVVREVSHMEPDPAAVNYMSVPLMSQDYQHADPRYAADPYMVSFDHYDPYLGYPPQPGYPGPHGIYMPRSHSPHSPHSPSEHSRASPPHGMFSFFFVSFFSILLLFLIFRILFIFLYRSECDSIYHSYTILYMVHIRINI